MYYKYADPTQHSPTNDMYLYVTSNYSGSIGNFEKDLIDILLETAGY